MIDKLTKIFTNGPRSHAELVAHREAEIAAAAAEHEKRVAELTRARGEANEARERRETQAAADFDAALHAAECELAEKARSIDPLVASYCENPTRPGALKIAIAFRELDEEARVRCGNHASAHVLSHAFAASLGGTGHDGSKRFLEREVLQNAAERAAAAMREGRDIATVAASLEALELAVAETLRSCGPADPERLQVLRAVVTARARAAAGSAHDAAIDAANTERLRAAAERDLPRYIATQEAIAARRPAPEPAPLTADPFGVYSSPDA